MRSVSLTGIGSLSLALIVAVACGSEDSKKSHRSEGSGGEAGSALGGEGGQSSPTAGNAGESSGATTNGGQGATTNGGQAGDTSVTPGGGEAAEPASGGAGGAGSTEPPINGLYIGPDGSDTADGTIEAPFETLEHALSVAQAGDTVVFLDGAYTITGLAKVVPDGVDLMAENAGGVTLTGAGGALLSLAGSTRIEGLTFAGYGTPIQFAGGATATGELELVDASFDSCTQICIAATGTSHVAISSPSGGVLSNGGGVFLETSGEATATISGGEIKNHSAVGSSSGLVHATADSSVEVTDLTINDGGGRPVAVEGNATMVLTNTVFATLSQQLAGLRGAGTLHIIDSDWSIKAAVATPYECIRGEVLTAGKSKLIIEGSKLHGCSTAINAELPAVLTITGSELYDLSFAGMDLGYGASTVRITDSKIYDVNTYSIRIGGASNKIDFKMRGTEVEAGSGTGGNDAMRIDGNAASTYDFGTLADPGGNTILGSSDAITGIRVMMSTVTVQAVGNTWTPLKQDADADGHYAPKTGKVYELVSPVSTGQNVIAAYTAVTVRLAQIP